MSNTRIVALTRLSAGRAEIVCIKGIAEMVTFCCARFIFASLVGRHNERNKMRETSNKYSQKNSQSRRAHKTLILKIITKAEVLKMGQNMLYTLINEIHKKGRITITLNRDIDRKQQ